MSTIKQKVIREIFPFLKLKEKNISWYRRLYIYFEIFSFVMIISWTICCVLGYKYFFSYTYTYTYDNLHFYMREEINNKNKFEELMHKVEKPLSTHQIDLNTLDANIYFVNNDLLYYFSVLPSINSFNSLAYTFNGSTYFMHANIEKNLVLENKFGKVQLSTVLAHELTHIWQNKIYTFKKILHIPTWVMEGYATYVSGEEKEFNINIRDFIGWIQKNEDKASGQEFYMLWTFMIKHAIEKMHKSVDDLHVGKVSYDEVLDSLLQEYNITKE